MVAGVGCFFGLSSQMVQGFVRGGFVKKASHGSGEAIQNAKKTTLKGTEGGGRQGTRLIDF
jgi:hypothetical protein